MDGLQRLTRARAGLVLSAPFYATLALGLKYERDDSIETMATDGERILYCEAFVHRCSDAELRGVLCHEVMHVANLHHLRRGNRDARQWNEACDYAINGPLLAEGFTLPKGALVDPQFDGKSAEQIFTALGQQGQGQQGQGQQGQGQQGQGQQGQGHPIPGGVIDAPQVGDKAATDAAIMDIQAKVIQAAQAAKNAGQSSAAGARLVDSIKKPVVDWRVVLRRYVDSAARYQYAWHRPNRRHVAAGLYLPGKVPDGIGRLCVVIDTSGSIDRAALGRFMAELRAAVECVCPEQVDIIQCNTRVIAHDTFERGAPIDVQIQGGGGTDMTPALALCNGASATIVLTDCEFSKEPNEPDSPVLWARWGGGGKVPGYGELIDV